jgi:hypothetical protein
LIVVDACQVGGHPAPRLGVLACLLMSLQGADAYLSVARDEHKLVADADRSAGERARDDGSRALGREHPVDPQPWSAVVDRGGRRSQQFVKRSPQVVDAETGNGVDIHDPGALEERAGDAVVHLERRQLPRVVVDEADLGEGDESVADAQQLDDPQVLLRLRLPPLGRSHHE